VGWSKFARRRWVGNLDHHRQSLKTTGFILMSKNRRKRTLYDWPSSVTQELGEYLRFAAWEEQVPPSLLTRKALAWWVVQNGVPQRFADPQRMAAYLAWNAKNAL
jgi:hypothetical protein